MPNDVGKAELICTRCARAFHEPGNCPDHPEEPLMDTSDREVCLFLMQLDDKAANRYMMYWILPCLVAGVILGCVAAWIWNGWIEPLFYPEIIYDSDARGENYTWMMITGGALGGSTSTILGRKTFRPRWGKYTEKLPE